MSRRAQLRRSADRTAALRDRTALNRRIMLGAVAAGVLIVAAFSWYRLGRPPVRDGSPSWSHDGSQIVYYSEQGNGSADLFVMRADGTSPRRLLETSYDEGGPAFSPDGTRIAFDTDRDGNFEIYVVGVDGTGLRRLTDDPGRDVAPAWSPDGATIVFMSDRSRREFDIFRVNADGAAVAPVTGANSNWFPQFAPVDPPRLALHVGRDVHVLDLGSGALTRLTTEPNDGMYPSWSPDGSRIAFMSARNGPTEIFTMNADGSGQTRLVSMPTGSAIDPRWSPDGRRIVFVHVAEEQADDAQHEAQERAIYVVEVATGRLTRLSR